MSRGGLFDWELAEKIGAKIREKSKVGPHAPPSAIALALSRPVRVRPIPGKRQALTIPGEPHILISPELDYWPRREFSVAHELAESELQEKSPKIHEAFCDRIAAAILLPRPEFLSSLVTHALDMRELRQLWPWASWSAMARRITELMPNTIATGWHNAKPTWRTSSNDPFSAEKIAVGVACIDGHGRAHKEGRMALAWLLESQWVLGVSIPT